MEPRWLEWSRELQAVAQTGLTYARDPFDIERYEQIRNIAAHIPASYMHLADEEALAMLAVEKRHATPKVDVRGVVFRDDRILMVREKLDGLWTLPGGWVDVNESASASSPAAALQPALRQLPRAFSPKTICHTSRPDV